MNGKCSRALSIIFLLTTILFQAKERSTLLWLLSKAYKGRVPTDLRSPHYKESGVSFQTGSGIEPESRWSIFRGVPS